MIITYLNNGLLPLHRSVAPSSAPIFSHFAPRPPHALRATDLGAQSVQHIADFRARFGEATWLNEELKQLDEFGREFGGQAAFEATRADGNSDGDWSHQ